jgi:sarcosine oxidase subunit gamma
MPNDDNRASPLVEFLAARGGLQTTEESGVSLYERPFMGHINLRGNPSDRAFLRAVEAALGTSVPLEPNTLIQRQEVTALWLGPNEWLILTSPDQRQQTAGDLASSVSYFPAAVTDVSSSQTVINLQGPRVREVLNKSCTLDLHPRAFVPGRCAQTNLAKTTVIVWQLDDPLSFEVIVRRSFADYLARWLADAAREYGLTVATPNV